MADTRPPKPKKTLEERVDDLEKLGRARQTRLNELEQKMLRLEKSSSATSVVVRSAVWEEFTPEFWRSALVKLTDLEGPAEEVEWLMPDDTVDILSAMNARRKEYTEDHFFGSADKQSSKSAKNKKKAGSAVDSQDDAEQEGPNRRFYFLVFKGGKGKIPRNWATYSSYKFALKVKYFLNLTVEEQLKCTTAQNPAYTMFKDAKALLYGRLKMLSSHVYEIHKLTWTRMRVNIGAEGRNVGPSTMTVDEMIEIQTPFMQAFLKSLAKETQLKNRIIYSEATAGGALAALLRNFKDTDRYVGQSHDIDSTKFQNIVKKTKITAPVPLPLDFLEEDKGASKRKRIRPDNNTSVAEKKSKKVAELLAEVEAEEDEFLKTFGTAAQVAKRKRNRPDNSTSVHEKKSKGPKKASKEKGAKGVEHKMGEEEDGEDVFPEKVVKNKKESSETLRDDGKSEGLLEKKRRLKFKFVKPAKVGKGQKNNRVKKNVAQTVDNKKADRPAEQQKKEKLADVDTPAEEDKEEKLAVAEDGQKEQAGVGSAAQVKVGQDEEEKEEELNLELPATRTSPHDSTSGSDSNSSTSSRSLDDEGSEEQHSSKCPSPISACNPFDL